MQKKESITVAEAQKKMEYFCSYQERCHKEVMTKLMELDMIPEAKDIIITRLIQHNYLNETRFAKSFARGKFRIKKWGKNRTRDSNKKHTQRMQHSIHCRLNACLPFCLPDCMSACMHSNLLDLNPQACWPACLQYNLLDINLHRCLHACS